jgi:hypothetical protein
MHLKKEKEGAELVGMSKLYLRTRDEGECEGVVQGCGVVLYHRQLKINATEEGGYLRCAHCT